MEPLYFGSPARPLFGAFHPTRSARHRGAAVVLCGPFGHEELHAHRAQRHLAERLSDAGFPALRFDYDATGDSAGDDREGGRVAAWRDSVLAAVSAIREKTSLSRVVLVGLRAGALLALTVAASAPEGQSVADRLVLWNPVLSGKAHLRELLRLHKVLFPKGKGDEPKSPYDEALGFIVRKDTLADMGKLDATVLPQKPASACLVIGGNDNPSEDKLLEALRSAGVEVEYKHLPGHPFLVTDPHKSDVPDEMLGAIVDYLSQAYPEDGESNRQAPSRTTRWETTITRGPQNEEAWQIEGEKPRFGVLTLPADKPSPSGDGPGPGGGKPAVILMNAGSIHRVGPNRSFVRMARRWADLGYPVLRMDLSGIGDSPAPEGCVENLPYPRDAVKDAQAAMSALESRGIATKFILSGLCSGADIAFRTAVIDRRVSGAWMVNPQAFYFPSSDTLKEYMRAELQATYYENAFWQPERWKRVLRGEVDLKRVAGVMRDKVESAVRRRVTRLFGEKTESEGKPESRDVIADLRSIAARGADTFLLCSEDDPGLVYLQKYFGGGLDGLTGLPGYRREIVKNTDHTFTPLWSQDALSDMLTEHLQKRHG